MSKGHYTVAEGDAIGRPPEHHGLSRFSSPLEEQSSGPAGNVRAGSNEVGMGAPGTDSQRQGCLGRPRSGPTLTVTPASPVGEHRTTSGRLVRAPLGMTSFFVTCLFGFHSFPRQECLGLFGSGC